MQAIAFVDDLFRYCLIRTRATNKAA